MPLPVPRKKQFKGSDLEKVGSATYEEVIAGDFVHLASGSPLGLVQSIVKGQATVVWFNQGMEHSTIAWECLRPVHHG